MATVSAHEIYKRYVSSLPVAERLRLLAMLAQGLASESSDSKQSKRNIMELHGLGKEIWEGVEPQNYVDQLRDEWARPIESDET